MNKDTSVKASHPAASLCCCTGTHEHTPIEPIAEVIHDDLVRDQGDRDTHTSKGNCRHVGIHSNEFIATINDLWRISLIAFNSQG